MIAESLAEQLEKVASETSHILYLLAEGEKIAAGAAAAALSTPPMEETSDADGDVHRPNVSNRASYTPHELPNEKTRLGSFAERISKTLKNVANTVGEYKDMGDYLERVNPELGRRNSKIITDLAKHDVAVANAKRERWERIEAIERPDTWSDPGERKKFRDYSLGLVEDPERSSLSRELRGLAREGSKLQQDFLRTNNPK